MKFSFDIIKDAGKMDTCYFLVKQLSPELTHADYTKYIQQMVKHGYFQLVMKDEEKIVAVSGIWIATKLYCGKYLEMDNVVVDEGYRSAGLGKILYEKCVEIAKENNCNVIMLDAYKENVRAHEFYEAKGFIKRGFHFIKKL
jgi:ribosomal protein S18 acetylase RimI-like enzyme